ncbi:MULTISPECIES: hypothetical protein [Streptacidiphilus]|uniref:Uncharacterized protein n=1 Tax=Streptacidiphilus cavernicola TaxID=3342716 RepID=A0ABV6UPE0_9ACTN|nr:hypothetical protein [Streptacidiphilus jeojiense]
MTSLPSHHDMETELRAALARQAGPLDTAPAPYERFRRRVRRRRLAQGAALGAAVLAATGMAAFGVPGVGHGGSGVPADPAHWSPAIRTWMQSWPVLGDQVDDSSVTSRARTAAAVDLKVPVADTYVVYAGHVQGVPVAVVVAPVSATDAQYWFSTNGTASRWGGVAPNTLLEGQFQIGTRTVELVLPPPGVDRVELSPDVDWTARGTAVREPYRPLPLTGGMGVVSVVDDGTRPRLRAYAGSKLVDDEVVGPGAGQDLNIPVGLIDSMVRAYGHPVTERARQMIQFILQSESDLGVHDATALHPQLLWTGASASIGPDSVLVQIQARGGTLQLFAGADGQRQDAPTGGGARLVPASRSGLASYLGVRDNYQVSDTARSPVEILYQGGASASVSFDGGAPVTASLDGRGHAVITPTGAGGTHRTVVVRDKDGRVLLSTRLDGLGESTLDAP